VAESTQSPDPSLTTWRRNVARFFTRQFREGWPAVLFVPALIFMLHDFPLLRAIDGYAFLVIGNLGAIADLGQGHPSKGTDNRVVVALIDPETREQRYSERTPLDRCELRDDIRVLYGAQPEVLAIDIELSPAPELRSRQEEIECEKELYALIKGQDGNVTRTVLMTPTRPLNPRLLQKQCEWQAGMQMSGVLFGRPDLPVTSGMTLEHYDDERSFGVAVRRAREKRPLPAQTRELLDSLVRECTSKAERESSDHSDRINPLLYGSSICPVPLKVQTAVQKEPAREEGKRARTLCLVGGAADAEAALADRLRAAFPDKQPRVVFFGAGYGEDDVFLTPLGWLYGVEIHAAAYLSHFHRIEEKEWMNLTGDLLIAFVFSFFISIFWQQYFRNRLSVRARDRQVAAKHVFFLLVTFSVLLIVACLLSLWALRGAGVWLSPVPIAIGMLLDAFILGSVHVAIHACHEQVNAAVRTLQAAPPESFATVASMTLKQRRTPAISFRDSIKCFFVADWLRLFRTGQYYAGTIIFMRRAMWVGVVGAALAIAAHSVF
jgi:CHASE2 domain-containing sensor protein